MYYKSILFAINFFHPLNPRPAPGDQCPAFPMLRPYLDG